MASRGVRIALVALAVVAVFAFAAPPAAADSCSVTVLGCPPGAVPWPSGGKTACGGGPHGWSCAYLW